MSDAIERIEPGTRGWDAYYGNHICRYRFAAEQLSTVLRNGPVLDAACGVGYGSRHLATQLGRQVVAVDRDERALVIASRHFAGDGVTFIKDDCHTLLHAKERGPYEAIVSFETLEHLPRPADFLTSCRALLAPHGTFVVSTPNSRVSSPDGQTTWEYHEREYTAPEFLAILSAAGFDDVKIYGQRLTALGELRAELRGELHALASNPFARAGRWLQSRVRGREFRPLLPEKPSDFEIVPFASAEELDRTGSEGPFVLIAVARAER